MRHKLMPKGSKLDTPTIRALNDKCFERRQNTFLCHFNYNQKYALYAVNNQELCIFIIIIFMFAMSRVGRSGYAHGWMNQHSAFSIVIIVCRIPCINKNGDKTNNNIIISILPVEVMLWPNKWWTKRTEKKVQINWFVRRQTKFINSRKCSDSLCTRKAIKETIGTVSTPTNNLWPTACALDRI